MESKNDKDVKDVKKIVRRVKERIAKELGQNGGFGPREDHFVSGIEGGTKAFGAIISNLTNMIINSGSAIANGVEAAVSIATLPRDFSSIVDKPNEPLPSNTPIKKIIDDI
jgi:thiamine pyrophosphokinase